MKDLQVRDVMMQEVTTLKRNDQLSLANDIMQLGRFATCRYLMMMAGWQES